MTVEGPQRRVDVALASDVPIAEVIPTVVELCGQDGASRRPAETAEWRIAPVGQGPLPPTKSLRDCGITDGAVLALKVADEAEWQTISEPALTEQQVTDHAAEYAAVFQPPPQQVVPDPNLRNRSRSLLPERISASERLAHVWQAVTTAGSGYEHPIPAAAGRPAAPTVDALAQGRGLSLLERVQRAWWETDYKRQLDAAVAAPRLQKCPVVAVISPKGGVGKTTVAVLLGTLLAMVRSDRIVAVDSNPDYGTLGRSLTPEHPIYVDDLLEVLEHPALTVTLLDRSLGRAAHGLMVLPAPVDPDRMARLDPDSYRRVVVRLRELVGAVVLDCGPGLHDPAARAAMEAADQVVLVSDAEPATARLVTEAAARLDQSGVPYLFVVNRLPGRGSRLNLDLLARQVPNARGLAVIPAEPRAAGRVAAGAFNWALAPESWQVAVRELAALLVADWGALGLTM